MLYYFTHTHYVPRRWFLVLNLTVRILVYDMKNGGSNLYDELLWNNAYLPPMIYRRNHISKYFFIVSNLLSVNKTECHCISSIRNLKEDFINSSFVQTIFSYSWTPWSMVILTHSAYQHQVNECVCAIVPYFCANSNFSHSFELNILVHVSNASVRAQRGPCRQY